MSDFTLQCVWSAEKAFSFAKIIFHAPLPCQIITLKVRLTEVNKFKAHFKYTAFVQVERTGHGGTKESLMIQQCKRKDLKRKLHLILLHMFRSYSCFYPICHRFLFEKSLVQKPTEYLNIAVNEFVFIQLLTNVVVSGVYVIRQIAYPFLLNREAYMLIIFVLLNFWV
jgi:hypothetical protein